MKQVHVLKAELKYTSFKVSGGDLTKLVAEDDYGFRTFRYISKKAMIKEGDPLTIVKHDILLAYDTFIANNLSKYA